MSNNNTQTCAFDSNECNGKIHKVGDKVSIPKTNIELISCGMFLCMFNNYKFCDANNCLLSNTMNSSNIILIYKHSYHKECLSLLNEKCTYCFNYLSESIKTNINSLNRRLYKPLKDNELPEITKDEDDLGEDYEGENIESLLEQVEHNIDNQYEIQYHIWQNYNSMM
jgi:hypothetical protein